MSENTTNPAKRKGRKKKSEFYHLRKRVGFWRHDSVAGFLEISERTARRWDEAGAPGWAMRLLRLHDKKEIGIDGWHGWMFSRGKLINTRLKLQFPPWGLERHRADLDALRRAENEIDRLKGKCPAMRSLRKAGLLWPWAAALAKRLER